MLVSGASYKPVRLTMLSLFMESAHAIGAAERQSLFRTGHTVVMMLFLRSPHRIEADSSCRSSGTVCARCPSAT